MSVENLNGASFGVGVVKRATFAMAFRNQFVGTNVLSSGVYTGGLKTEDRSFGRCGLLIKCSSVLLRVSKRAWFLLNDVESFFVGGGKFIGSPNTDARLFTMMGFLANDITSTPILIGFPVNNISFAGKGFLVDDIAFTFGCIGFPVANIAFTSTGFLVDDNAFTTSVFIGFPVDKFAFARIGFLVGDIAFAAHTGILVDNI